MRKSSLQSEERCMQSRQANTIWRCGWACLLAFLLGAQLHAEVTFTSPGLAPTRMDDQGRLVEDWGSITVSVAGPGLPAATPATLQALKLDGVIPAAQAQSSQIRRAA